MTAYFVASWVLTGLFWLEAMRRPEAQWIAADRSRAGWLGYGTGLGIFGLAPLLWLAYLIGVVPRFSHSPVPRDRADRARVSEWNDDIHTRG